jgi:hypothetical protein
VKSVITSITDDIDGGADAEPVTFGFQGVTYSIDLSQKNLDKLSKALTPFIDSAKRERGPRVAATRKATVRGKAERPYDLVSLREWAGKSKIAIPARGRIPVAVVEQYKAAGGR